MGRKIALGAGSALPVEGKAVMGVPESSEERIAALESQVGLLIETMKEMEKVRTIFSMNSNLNMDGIPVGTVMYATSMRGGMSRLTADTDGYFMGGNKYNSLSSAAEAASGVRRGGWSFWRLPDGRTAKEVFGRD